MTSRIATAGWAVAAVVVGAWLALVEVFWLPLRAGGVPLPLSVLAAAAGNLLLVGLAHRLSGSRAVAVLPAVAWLVVALAAMVPRSEGDLVMIGSGALGVISLAFLLFGTLGAAFAYGRVLGRARPAHGARAPEAAAAPR